MNIALIIHRFGKNVIGGSEKLCCLIAKHLQENNHTVTVITSCAKDYIYWKNYFKPGKDNFDGVDIIRFPIKKERVLKTFENISSKVFYNSHTIEDEEEWVRECGPYCPSLVDYLKNNRDKYDRFIFFAYRYYNTYFGLQEVSDKSILVPTAEMDNLLDLQIYRRFFSLPRAIIYISKEEKDLVNAKTHNHNIPGIISALGINIPQNIKPSDFKERYNINYPFIIYLGRIDSNKGSRTLFKYFINYKKVIEDDIKLVLCGNSVEKIPEHKDIIHIGFIPEDMKYNALSASEFLVMPSVYESLCIVTLEAWAMKKAILVNERCNVLKGQVRRAKGGLYFNTYKDFIYCMRYLLKNREITKNMGINGYNYILDNYNWNKVMKDYEETLGI